MSQIPPHTDYKALHSAMHLLGSATSKLNLTPPLMPGAGTGTTAGVEHPWLVLAGCALLLALLHRVVAAAAKQDPLGDIPGPWLAKYTSLLLAYHARKGKRYLYVDSLHKKYGPLVRISPTHISCASPTSLGAIYAQGTASLPKTAFYRAFFVNRTPSLFSTQDRRGHAVKRRVLAHPFSYGSVRQFEGWIRRSVALLVGQLDRRAVRGGERGSGRRRRGEGGVGISATTLGRAAGSEGALAVDARAGDGGGAGEEGRGGWVDVLMWLNCLTFDVISDLAFGEPLGMLRRGTDVLPEDSDSPSDLKKNQLQEEEEEGAGGGGGGGESTQQGVASLIDYRGRTAAFLGLFPALLTGGSLEWLTRWIPDPFVQRGLKGTDTLSKIALRCVQNRLAADASSAPRRGDLLDRLVDDMRAKQALAASQGTAEGGEGVSEEDVVTDAMLLLTAGSDTTANSTAAILFWIYRTPRVLNKLRAELEEALGVLPVSATSSAVVNVEGDGDGADGVVGALKEREAEEAADELGIPLHDQVKNLKYLNATIDEALRLFATNAFGLPRVVPEGMSVCVDGRTFFEGTELSSPAYTIQRDPQIWGAGADEFRPERWLEAEERGEGEKGEKGEKGEEKLSAGEMKKYLLTFGMGPRACIGKNLAMLQIQILVATFVMRYDLELRDADGELRSVEGFMHKPVDLWARVKLRV